MTDSTPAQGAAGSRVRLERDGDIAVIVIDNPPVNAGSWDVRRGIVAALDEIGADAAVRAAVLIGGGRTFIAGSDIREFGKPLAEPTMPQVIVALESCPKPVVAAIHGAALGGGFEVALGCDARVAVPGALVGLPEVKLGMIPGAGGTQRVPRLTGIAKAIELICNGTRVPAEQAEKLGLVDAVVQGDLRTEAVAFARRLTAKRVLATESVPSEPAEAVEQAAGAALKRGRGRPAVAAAIEAVKDAARLPFTDALARERTTFQDLRNSEDAAALRHIFFAEREAARIKGVENAVARPVKEVGILGAGTMGSAIAIAFADAGFSVTLVEKEQAALDRGLGRAKQNYDRLVAAGRLAADKAEARLGLIRPTVDFSALASADLVIEAVFEDMEVKKAVMRQLDAVARPGAVLATNTSYLDVNALAAETGRPGDVLGMHFFSPANIMRLLEVVRAEKTAPDALATALAVGKKLGKVAVVAAVGEGFIGNRIYAAYRRQCEFMLEEGAYPEEVDAAIEAFGLAMGPFAVSDLSGLDIAWNTRKRLAATRDPRERYVEIADRLCEAGRFGQKAGKGWYDHSAGGRRGVPDPDVHKVVDAASAAKGIARRKLSQDEIQRRALAGMVNEAALLLDEGIAQRPSDVDLVLVNGYGFPDHRGGPLFWASRRSDAEIETALDEIETATGFGFRRGPVRDVLRQVRESTGA